MSCAAPARPCWPTWRCSTSTAIRTGSAAATYSLALRLAYRAPDRTLTDEEVAERRRTDRRGAGRRARRVGPWRIACPCSVPPGSPVRSTRELLYGHPSFELQAVTARSRRRRPSRRALSAPPRAADARGARPRPSRRRRCRDRRLPPRRGGAAGRGAARARREGRRSERRLPAARRRPSTRRWYREHPRSGAARGGRLRPAGALPRARSATPTWSPTRAATRRPRCSRSRRWRAPA